MLLQYLPYILRAYVVLACVLTLCMVHAHDVNERRDKDDPKKRNFHFGAVIFVPWLWPLIILSSVVVVFLEVLVYMIFLGLTLLLLLIFKKPRVSILDKIATKIGNQLLEINTYLIKLMFGNIADAPQSP